MNSCGDSKPKAYGEETITGYATTLEALVKRGANLFDRESVKAVVAKQDTWNPSTKSKAFKAVRCFLKTYDIETKFPKYKIQRKLPFIPAEEEIDQLISGCQNNMATFLQVLKETGMRYGEAYNLEWDDLDITARTLAITPEKGSNPRTLKISPKLLTMLLNLPKTPKRIFIYKAKYYAGKSFRRTRKRLATKLGNPRLLQIHFHTLRYWKGTSEYRKFPSLLHVMVILCHKDIKNVMLYVQLTQNTISEEFICEAAKNIQEASKLIEGGFEYVTEMEGIKLFRKRK